MHMGATTGPALSTPMLDLDGRTDGAVSADGKVMGCYLHGLFASDAFRAAFLERLGARATSGLAWEQRIESTLDALAEHLESSLDLDAILRTSRHGAAWGGVGMWAASSRGPRDGSGVEIWAASEASDVAGVEPGTTITQRDRAGDASGRVRQAVRPAPVASAERPPRRR